MLSIVTGNDFECDCHLAWMYRLRHEAKSVRIRTALENFLCKFNGDPAVNAHFTYFDRNLIGSNNLYDVDDKNNLKEYEDTEDVFSDDIDVANIKTTVSAANQRALLQIPVESLPCPQIVNTVTDRTYTHPSQNEVKDYRNFFQISSARQFKVSFLVLVSCFSAVRVYLS